MTVGVLGRGAYQSEGLQSHELGKTIMFLRAIAKFVPRDAML